MEVETKEVVPHGKMTHFSLRAAAHQVQVARSLANKAKATSQLGKPRFRFNLWFNQLSFPLKYLEQERKERKNVKSFVACFKKKKEIFSNFLSS